MSHVRVLSSPVGVVEALVAGMAWSTELDFCTPAVDSRLGRWPFWRALLDHEKKLHHAYVALDGLRSEPHALEHLHRLGALRLVPAADGSFQPHVFRFRRGDAVRIIMGSGSLVPEGLMAPLSAMTLWEGDDLDSYAAGTEGVFERAKHLAHLPDPDELRDYATTFMQAARHRDALTELGAPFIRRTSFDGETSDLEAVESPRPITAALRLMKEQLRDGATFTARQTLGFHGGNFDASLHWSSPLGIWSFFRKLDDRHGNYFGVERPDRSKALPIVVQVNVPFEGVDRKTGGAIARDAASGRTFLVHRGRIGGGQRGVGAELFWSRFRGGVTMRESDREGRSRVVIVGEIGAPSFLRDVAGFVHEVARIKRAA